VSIGSRILYMYFECMYNECFFCNTAIEGNFHDKEKVMPTVVRVKFNILTLCKKSQL